MVRNPHTTLSPGAIFGRRVSEERKRQGLSQDDLVKRLEKLGRYMDRSNLSRIERGETTGQLDNVVALALALGVAPIHLMVPREGEEAVELAPKRRLSAGDARLWIGGRKLLPESDPVAFVAAMSDEEQEQLARAGVSPIVFAAMGTEAQKAWVTRRREVVEDVLAGRASERRKSKRRTKEENDA
jgi:transcriptional regulator with XRE-family HTH domain